MSSEEQPKPWHDAKPGEVWILTFGYEPEPHLVDGDSLFVDEYGNTYELYDRRITAGYCIWPAEEKEWGSLGD